MADKEFQPLAGDPDKVLSYGQKYKNIGDAIARSVTVLRKIHEGDAGKSKAIDALKKKAGDVADDIDKAKDRYQKTADTLLVYGPKLRQAQDDANTAITQIADKQNAADAAHQHATATQQAVDTASDADKSDAKKDAATASQAAQDADAAVEAAKNAWHDAEQAKNTAAQDAINSIHDVIYGDHAITDSWWDNWGSKALEVFKSICKWAAILSVFLSWVPVLGEVLLALAAIGALIDVIDATVKAISGDGSWWGVLGAVGMLALTVVGGSVAARLAKSFKSTALLKVAGTVGRRAAGRDAIAKVIGEDAVKAVARGTGRLSQRGLGRLVESEGKNVLELRTVPKEFAKSVAKDLEKKYTKKIAEDGIDSLAKLKSDGLKKVLKEGIIPDLRHPVEFLKTQAGLGGTYDNLAHGVRLVLKDPAAFAGDRAAILHLVTTGGLAGAYQGYETYKAVHGHVENIVEGKWADEGASLFSGGSELKTIVENVRSMDFRNKG